jgi:hypothetical protein
MKHGRMKQRHGPIIFARSSYLLQQGKFVADVVYYYGEDNNITGLFGGKLPDVPEGYNYDFINADALINLLSVKDGKLVTPSGMSYRVLVLDSNARTMSLPVLRKIRSTCKRWCDHYRCKTGKQCESER